MEEWKIFRVVRSVAGMKEKSIFERDHSKFKVADSNSKFIIRSKATLRMVARALIVNHLDFEATVRMLFPRDTPERKFQTMQYLQEHPDLMAEVEEQLRVPGLDETSKTEFVREMWRWLWSGDNELKGTAARILGKAFMPEKSKETPEPLKLSGMDDGLRQMGLLPANEGVKIPVVNVGKEFSKDEEN